MQYSYYEDFDFHRNGHSNRRDRDAKPRVLLVRMDEIHNEVHFHVAGDPCIRTGLVLDAASDDELVAGLEPQDALRLGVEYQRAKQKSEGVAYE